MSNTTMKLNTRTWNIKLNGVDVLQLFDALKNKTFDPTQATWAAVTGPAGPFYVEIAENDLFEYVMTADGTNGTPPEEKSHGKA